MKMGGKRKRNEDDMSLLDSLWEAPLANDGGPSPSSSGGAASSRKPGTPPAMPPPASTPKPRVEVQTKADTQKQKELQASERVVLEVQQALQLIAEGDGILALNVKRLAALEGKIQKRLENKHFDAPIAQLAFRMLRSLAVRVSSH